jgi:hypothetical protein
MRQPLELRVIARDSDWFVIGAGSLSPQRVWQLKWRSAQSIQRTLERRHRALHVLQLVQAEQPDAEGAKVC